MTILVKELRVSSIWFEAFPDIIAQDVPVGFLSSDFSYIREVEQMKAGNSSWSLPWSGYSGRRFWEFYMERASLRSVGGGKAWKALIPIHQPSLAAFKPLPNYLYRVKLEGFYYPHGLAVAATAVIKEDLTLDKMVDKALQFWDEPLTVTWPSRATERQVLKLIIHRALDNMRKTAFGEEKPAWRVPKEPLTITAAIEGQVDPTPTSIAPNGEIHRALEALCRRDQLWRENALHPFEASSLRFKDKDYSRPDHVVYGLERGRSIWFPGYFTRENSQPIRKLGCYQRNLTLASMQTESLLALVPIAVGYLDRHAVMPVNLEGLSRAAVGTLARLYGGAQETYRSWNLHRQIQDSGLMEAIKSLRSYFGMQPYALFLPTRP